MTSAVPCGVLFVRASRTIVIPGIHPSQNVDDDYGTAQNTVQKAHSRDATPEFLRSNKRIAPIGKKLGGVACAVAVTKSMACCRPDGSMTNEDLLRSSLSYSVKTTQHGFSMPCATMMLLFKSCNPRPSTDMPQT
jgi:hypothetical protein